MILCKGKPTVFSRAPNSSMALPHTQRASRSFRPPLGPTSSPLQPCVLLPATVLQPHRSPRCHRALQHADSQGLCTCSLGAGTLFSQLSVWPPHFPWVSAPVVLPQRPPLLPSSAIRFLHFSIYPTLSFSFSTYFQHPAYTCLFIRLLSVFPTGR